MASAVGWSYLYIVQKWIRTLKKGLTKKCYLEEQCWEVECSLEGMEGWGGGGHKVKKVTVMQENEETPAETRVHTPNKERWAPQGLKRLIREPECVSWIRPCGHMHPAVWLFATHMLTWTQGELQYRGGAGFIASVSSSSHDCFIANPFVRAVH